MIATGSRALMTALAAALFAVAGCNGTVSATTPSSGTGGSGPRKPPPGEVNPADTSIDASCANVLTGPYDDKLSVPKVRKVESDDYNARIDWGADTELDSGVMGYRLCWGPADGAATHGALFSQKIGQIFGVKNGVNYVAYVQAVDSFGHVSRPTPPVAFSGDPSRVDALHARMTGFFDDFNQPGALDELRWNIAYSGCNEPSASAMYVTPELHGVSVGGTHSYLPGDVTTPENDRCDRVQVIARPRAIFDFTNREGVIAFDFDGSFGLRESWYIDVFPYDSPADLVDITSHVTFSPGPGTPGRFLRFSQSIGNNLIIHHYDKNGDPLPTDPPQHDFGFTNPNVRLKNGVMRHWELHITKDRASVVIDGEKVYEIGNLNLDFTRGYVEWAQFGYNPPKEGLPWVQLRLDNFGFDGPRQADVETHNYKSSFNAVDARYLGVNPEIGVTPQTGPVSVPIPDSVANAKAARLMFTIQNGNYQWATSDSVLINGKSVPMPKPQPNNANSTYQMPPLPVPGPWWPYQQVMSIDSSLLVKGANAFDFRAASSKLLNFHLEIDFDPANAPPFTQPTAYLPQNPIPPFVAIGPTARYVYVDDNKRPIASDDVGSPVQTVYIGTDGSPGTAQVLHGISKIGIDVDNERPVTCSGHNLGVSKVELEVDGKVVQSIDTAIVSPAPGSHVEFQLDTTTLSTGDHTMYVRAYDSGGLRGRPYYDKGTGTNGAPPNLEPPLHFKVSN